jgi:hypothetical protein
MQSVFRDVDNSGLSPVRYGRNMSVNEPCFPSSESDAHFKFEMIPTAQGEKNESIRNYLFGR